MPFIEHPEITLLGPVGQLSNPNRTDGYQIVEGTFPPNQKDLDFGFRMYRIFTQEGYQMPPPMVIDEQAGSIYFLPQKFPTNAPEDLTVTAKRAGLPRRYVSPQIEEVRISSLREPLDPRVAKQLESMFLIESILAHYSAYGQIMTADILGYAMAYRQWSLQEDGHQQLGRIILLESKSSTEKEIEAQLEKLYGKIWVPISPTLRRVTLYAFFQEALTQRSYTTWAYHAAQGGAPYIATSMSEVASQEGGHRKFYWRASQEYAKDDPEGTEQDAYFVMWHLRMPGDYVLPDTEERMHGFYKELGVNRRSFAKNMYRNSLALSFLDRNKSMIVCASYANMTQLEESEIREALLMPRELIAEKFKSDESFIDLATKFNKLLARPPILGRF